MNNVLFATKVLTLYDVYVGFWQPSRDLLLWFYARTNFYNCTAASKILLVVKSGQTMSKHSQLAL